MCCLFIGKGRVIFNSLQVYKNIPICINNAADYLSRYHAHPRILCDGCIVQRLTFALALNPSPLAITLTRCPAFTRHAWRNWVNWIG